MPDAAKAGACFDDFGVEAFFAKEMEEIDSGEACADDASIELYMLLVRVTIEVAVSLAAKIPLHGGYRVGIDV